MTHSPSRSDTGLEIAIVGLAGRFPGAPDVDTFWQRIRDGVGSLTRLDDATLRARGVPDATLADPAYVKAAMHLDGMDRFDAGFFGFTPREAEWLDPQQRVFLETAWEALEHAGHDSAGWPGPIALFAGSGANVYLLRHLLPAFGAAAGADIASLLGLMNGNDKDSLATRAAYKLDLRGPAVSVQTACSTSLAAVHLACRSLLNHEADMALAGGVWLNLLQRDGYRHQDGAILSPDGVCRAFDARAAGTVIGSGAGVVVLRRLADALADGDTVHAVIKGSAMNNDGAGKVGFAAPSVQGQADVILAAHAMADVGADSIGLVEAHGTGTALGDPVEVAALTEAFRAGGAATGACALGSVKTNVGHLDAAAGVTGLIKAAMALKHRTLPPSLNFEQPNPRIDFAAGPFRVITEARPWPAGETPRRAGVSSFGMGGTNVHVVLEEAPAAPAPVAAAGSRDLLRVSARSATARDAAVARLDTHLAAPDAPALSDVAHTLCRGRRRFEHRAAKAGDTGWVTGRVLSAAPSVALMFPGQGSQHVGMGLALYRDEPVFRDAVADLSRRLAPHLGGDLAAVLYPAAHEADAAAARLDQTAWTQPALFVVGHALATLWAHRGVRPDALLGHSIGEYVAACLAGVWSVDDALKLVAARGRLLQSCAPGAMLAVGLPAPDLAPWLADGCELAAVNAPDACVLSGRPEAIERAQSQLAGRGVAVRRLAVSHAFHSSLTDPVLPAFAEVLAGVATRPPQLPFVSNLTGTWITETQARSADYWVAHLRGTVRFADGLQTLCERPDRVLLEAGPGDTLARLASRHPARGDRPVLTSLPRAGGRDPVVWRSLAQLWVAGVEVDDPARPDARRVPLPTYPFERQSYWIEADAPATPADDGVTLHRAVWRRADAVAASSAGGGRVLLLADRGAFAHRLMQALHRAGREVVCVESGDRFARLGAGQFTARPHVADDLAQVWAAVGPVADVCHLWSWGDGPVSHERGFHSVVALAQAIGAAGSPATVLTVVTHGLDDVTGDEPLRPDAAVLHGLARVIPQEQPTLRVRMTDVVRPAPESAAEARLAAQLVRELATAPEAAAWRGAHRWVRGFDPLPAAAADPAGGDAYLITGGFGGIGLALAEHLVRRGARRLALLGRRVPDAGAVGVRLAALEAAGVDLMRLQADVADADALTAAVARVRSRFGALAGVVHAAGVTDGRWLHALDRDAVDSVWAAKLRGANHLLAALDGGDTGFVLLCSSLASVAGGLGMAAYAAANAGLDALATAWSRDRGVPVLSVGWDGWRDVGMAAGKDLPAHLGLDNAQAFAAFDRIVTARAPHTLVTRGALERRLAASRDPAAVPEPVVQGSTHPRPALATPWVAPEGELAIGLAALWAGFLGLETVGADDDLFELGGDSLLAIQLLARIKAQFGVDVPPADFFRRPTVASLAETIELLLIDQIAAAPHEVTPA